MNKQINFGNSKGLIINDLNVKNKIFDYLFNSLNLSKYRYVMLNNIQRLNFLKKNPHYVSPNFKGYNYLMIFKSFNNKNYCVTIEKKKMSYHKNHMDIKSINIIRIKVNTSSSIFDGSIFDCKLIKNQRQYIMLIKDCYQLMGNDMTTMEMKNKITHIDNIFKNQFRSDSTKNFKFKINKLYEYNDLENLINNVMPSCKIPNQGIIFYPKYSGITIIYLDKQQEKINIYSKENINFSDIVFNLTKFLKARNYSYESEGRKKVFWIKKTNIIDVYNVHEDLNEEKIGIALIPNLKISHLCRENIKDSPVKFLCNYNHKFKKWIPISKK